MPINQFTIKQGDTAPLVCTLIGKDGKVQQLPGGTVVRFSMALPDGTQKVIRQQADILDPAGRVSYTFKETETDIAALCSGEFEVTYPNGGGITTFPNNGVIRINIVKQIA